MKPHHKGRTSRILFLTWIRVVEGLCRGEGVGRDRFMIDITRTTPVVVTYGPAGLSGSVKMVGFVPRREYIGGLAEKAYRYAYVDRPKGMREIACILLREFYRMDLVEERVIGGLEMGFRHSWENIRATHKAALVFYTPPTTSFEVRCSVEVADEDNDYKRYLNSIHDLFH